MTSTMTEWPWLGEAKRQRRHHGSRRLRASNLAAQVFSTTRATPPAGRRSKTYQYAANRCANTLTALAATRGPFRARWQILVRRANGSKRLQR